MLDPGAPSDKSVREAFEDERASLLPLPANPFPCVERVDVVVGKQPYVRFDRNDYSVPHKLVRLDLVLLADLEQVRVCHGAEVVATHTRSWDAGQTIEDGRHIRDLVEHKRQARRHRGMDRLRHAAPASEHFLKRAAERGRNLGSMTAKLLELLDEHGPAELDTALGEVLQRDVIHVPSVRQLLEQRRHAQGRPVPLPVSINDPRLRRIVVRPHDLSTYDRTDKDDEDETQDS